MMYNQIAIIQGWSKHRNLYGCTNNVVNSTLFSRYIIILFLMVVIMLT